MSDTFLFVIVCIAVLCVIFILAMGLRVFTMGGAVNRKYANKIMRWRIAAQAIAAALILIYIFLYGTK